ncbi:MAG: hypothetical protein LUG12_08340 [Erysipelotrichaceae bacterium]|nr:hypothetical protein [Erysipelotrichaceae bacterium]
MKKIEIKSELKSMGKDKVILVQNENGHIGSVVIGEPYFKDDKTHVTMSNYNRLTHKDDVVARMYVEKAVLKYQCVVTCICGIHIDDITNEEMNEVMKLVKKDIEELLK